MQNLSIADEGLAYIFKCIAEYSGQCFYMLLYFAALVFIYLKADKKYRGVFIYPAIVAVLTVYNPLVPVLINSVFDVNQEYYRLLWISPVIPAIAFALTLVVFREDRSAAAKIAWFTAAVLLLLGAGKLVYSDGYLRVHNVYKMPQEVIAVSEAIHRDSEREFPKAVCDFGLTMQLRQYDATILLTGTREEFLNMLNGIEVDDFIAEKQKHPNRILSVILKNEDVAVSDFKESLEETDTEYVVLGEDSPVNSYLKKAGLKKISRAGDRNIWKYESDAIEGFEPADYTAVWESQ